MLQKEKEISSMEKIAHVSIQLGYITEVVPLLNGSHKVHIHHYWPFLAPICAATPHHRLLERPVVESSFFTTHRTHWLTPGSTQIPTSGLPQRLSHGLDIELAT